MYPYPQDDYKMPDEAGVGFLDVGCGVPGTHLSKFSSETMQGWGSGFFIRLAAHMQRASQSIGFVKVLLGAVKSQILTFTPNSLCHKSDQYFMPGRNLRSQTLYQSDS